MEKKEFQKLFREKMKSLGFSVRGNYASKFLEDDYLVGIFLDHSSYGKEYYIQYGVIYEPDEKRLPFSGWCDWSVRFKFTTKPNDDLSLYPIEDINHHFSRDDVIDWFEYEVRTAEDFEKQLEVNLEKRFAPLYDKSFVLNLLRNDISYFRSRPHETVFKIGKLLGLSNEEIMQRRSM